MFNQEARWDRPLPVDPEKESGPLEVLAYFGREGLKPLYFELGGQRKKIEKINYFWKERAGRGVNYYFKISASGQDFCLGFNNEDLRWRLLTD